jgi:hypothetical protein
MKRIKTWAWAAVLVWLCSPSSLLACAACFGKSDSNMARSLNAGIFSLMAVIVTVLGGAASFFVFLSRKAASTAKAPEQSDPPPAQPQS